MEHLRDKLSDDLLIDYNINSSGEVFEECGGGESQGGQCGLMETLAVPVSDPPLHGTYKASNLCLTKFSEI